MAGLRTQEVFGKMRACVAPMGSCYMYMYMHMCYGASAKLVFL